MDSIPFFIEGFTLERTDDREYILYCMKETLFSSVDDVERQFHELWMNDTLRVIASNLDDPRNEAFVLKDGDTKAGVLWLGRSYDQFTCEPIGYILGIFVEEGYRRRGLGKGLMASAETWCKENGLIHLNLNVSIHNPAAMSLYTGCGFKEQSIVMRKTIRK